MTDRPPEITSMTNDELVAAIAEADKHAGTYSEVQKLWYAHLHALLEIQRRRAEKEPKYIDHP